MFKRSWMVLVSLAAGACAPTTPGAGNSMAIIDAFEWSVMASDPGTEIP